MPFIRFSAVSFSYADPIDVLRDVTFDLHAGWTGLVGANGSGKSTLLGLVTGRIRSGQGVVSVDPPGAIIHLCPQESAHLTAAIRALAETWTRRAARVKARLDLEPGELERWDTLSPGERKRWQIGAALAAEPDVLLVDEPTNHLDARARDLLVAALARFRGIGVVASHDRALLEALTGHTVRVEGGGARLYRGPYSVARREWQAEERALREAGARARREQKAIRRRLADQRRDRASAEARISVRSRSKGKKDSDARSMLAKGRVQKGEARLSRKVSVLRRASERADARVADLAVTRPRGRSLFIDYQPASKRFVMAVDRDVVRAGPRPLLRDVRLAVARDSRIHVAGDNGAGKTTLLRALLSERAIPRQRVLYLPQTLDGERAAAVVAELHRRDRTRCGRLLQLAAALGLDPERVLATARPSPGELRKLAMAAGMAAGAWLLVLDEPTNHLDLPSIERLEVALADFPGAIVLVSHDQPFARAITDTVWRVGAGRVRVESPPDRATAPTWPEPRTMG